MNSFAKYLLIIFFAGLFAPSADTGANTIDSLRTKDDVMEFLAIHLDRSPQKGLHYRVDLIDSMQKGRSPYSELVELVEQYKCQFNFYLVDADGNGLTDLLVDVIDVLVVFDMGARFEHEMFRSRRYIGTSTLTDCSQALLLKHDLNRNAIFRYYLSCKFGYTGVGAYIDYITDTVYRQTLYDIDTLYAVRTVVDSVYLPDDPTDNNIKRSAEKVQRIRRDTFDYHLYNAIDTYVCKFGIYVRYQSGSKTEHVQKVQISINSNSGMTFLDFCDCYQVNKNGQCYFKYRDVDYSCVLDSSIINQIWGLMCYVSLKSKGRKYDEWVTHAPIVITTVFFDNGSVGRIVGEDEDIGNIGRMVKSRILASRNDWKASRSDSGLKCDCFE